MFRAKKMEGDIRLLADHPTVVDRSDIKEISSAHLVIAAILHSTGGTTGDNQTDMFHLAKRSAGRSAHMLRPFPSGS